MKLYSIQILPLKRTMTTEVPSIYSSVYSALLCTFLKKKKCINSISLAVYYITVHIPSDVTNWSYPVMSLPYISCPYKKDNNATAECLKRREEPLPLVSMSYMLLSNNKRKKHLIMFFFSSSTNITYFLNCFSHHLSCIWSRWETGTAIVLFLEQGLLNCISFYLGTPLFHSHTQC